MTSCELREHMRDTDLNDPVKVQWLGLLTGIALVDVLEQIREEMITRMPLVGERGINDV